MAVCFKALNILVMLVVAQVIFMPLHASTVKVDEPNQENSCAGLDEYLAPRNIVEIDRGRKWSDAFEAVKKCLLAHELSPKPEVAGKLATLVALLAPDEDFNAVFGSPDEEFTDQDVFAFVDGASKSNNNDGWYEYAIGSILFNGWFQVKEDEESACKFFKTAHDKGAGLAAYLLYECFSNGVTGAPDKTEAYGLLKSSADDGDPRALMELGRLAAWPDSDENSKPNLEEAKRYLRAAMARGHDTAADILVFVLLQESDDRQSAEEALDILDAYSSKTDNRQNFDRFAIRETFILVNLGARFRNKIEKFGLENKLDRARALKMLGDEAHLGVAIDTADFIIASENPHPFEFMTKAEFSPTIKLLKKQASDTENEYFRAANRVLSDYYYYGSFDKTNPNLAIKFGLLAAEDGDNLAQYNYADRLFEFRHQIDHSDPIGEAIEFALIAAESDEPSEQSRGFNLAGIIHEHEGNFERAMNYYRMAYENGRLARNFIGSGAGNLLRLALQLGQNKNSAESATKLREMARIEDPDDPILAYDIAGSVSYEDWLLQRKAIDAAWVFHELGWLYRNQGLNEKDRKKVKLGFKHFQLCQMLPADLWMVKQCQMAQKDLGRNFVGEEETKLLAEASRELLELPKEYVAKSAGSSVAQKAGKSLALIFYADEYQSLENLVTPKNDANRLSNVLKNKYGYETKVIPNPDRRELIQELNAAKSLEENDKLIVYFAGHGKSEANTSFWLPVDASPDDDTQWLEDNTIKRKLSQIPARNVLVVADTCFSGNLTRGVEVVDIDINETVYEKFEATKSRVAISSGGDQPILDSVSGQHSIFSAAFLSYLERTRKPFSAQELVGDIQFQVLKTSIKAGLEQSPRFGGLDEAGHEGPGFVFYPKK